MVEYDFRVVFMNSNFANFYLPIYNDRRLHKNALRTMLVNAYEYIDKQNTRIGYTTTYISYEQVLMNNGESYSFNHIVNNDDLLDRWLNEVFHEDYRDYYSMNDIVEAVNQYVHGFRFEFKDTYV